MKKRPCLLENDWKKYNENFSDLIDSVPAKKQHSVELSKTLDIFSEAENLTAEEGNISWHSSNNETGSPVICGNRKYISSGGYCIKSTPAGSPILSQNFTAVRSTKKATRKLALMPLSPITPGNQLDLSFHNRSHFSINLLDESKCYDQASNHTLLAVPLLESDDDGDNDKIEEIKSVTNSTIESVTQDKIELFPSQTPLTEESPCIISSDEDSFTSEHDDHVSASKVSGSKWLEKLMQKLDNDQLTNSNIKFSILQKNIGYDSSKKQKFVRNGLAERLQRIIKQEQTEKVLFRHQLKDLTKENSLNQRSMKLKVVSHHKDGILHILECKILSNVDTFSSSNGKFYTLILNDFIVLEHKLDLMSVFTIFPPWKEVHIQEHNFPVLLCIYHLKVDSEPSLSVAASQNQFDSEKPACLSETVNNNWTKDCESLLEALEKQNSENGICLAATVQRQYRLASNSGFRLAWLCEDAFGVFFEIMLETSLDEDENWSRLIKHGEGQRLYFQKLFLNGRAIRSRSPALFSLIDSVWDCEGFGLQQVQNSQSQESQGDEKCHTLQAPGFCYLFFARRWQTTCYSCSTIIPNDVLPVVSELNRPRLDGSIDADVLYQNCTLLACADSYDYARAHPHPNRYSIAGIIIHVHFNTSSLQFEEDLSSQVSKDTTLVFIADHTTLNQTLIASVTVGPHRKIRMLVGSGIVVRDLVYVQDSGFKTDLYSQIHNLEKKQLPNNEVKFSSTIPLHVIPESNFFTELVNFKLPEFDQIDKDTNPGTFVQIKGVVCGVNMISSDCLSKASSSRDLPRTLEEIIAFRDACNVNDYLFEVLVMINLNIKVKLKSRIGTMLMLLPKDSSKLTKGKSYLNGLRFGPVNSYVYAKYVKTNVTLFYSEEILCF